VTREQRNDQIENIRSELSNSERRAFLAISALVGDTTNVPYELDWDELSEATLLEYEDVESILDYMVDLDVLVNVDYANMEIT